MAYVAGEDGIQPEGATSNGGQAGAITRLVRRMPGYGTDHNVLMFMYYILREALPINNSAIINRRFIEGEMVFKSKDSGLLRDINEFAQNLTVGKHAKEAQAIRGLNYAINAGAENADTYGLTAIEPAFDEAGRDIERLLLPNPRTLFYKADNEGFYRLWQQQKNGAKELTNPNLQLMAFTYNTEGPWPLPLLWGLPFVSEVVIRMVVSMNNLWWKAGDPAELYTIAYDATTEGLTDTTINKDLDSLQATIEAVQKNKLAGKVSDAFLGFKGGKIEKTPIGANPISDSLAQYFSDHYTTIAGQVVGRSQTPPWMYPDIKIPGEGLSGARSDNQNGMALGAAEKRNYVKAAVAYRIVNLWLTLNKSVRYINKYEIDWIYPNIQDEKLFEETRNQRETANGQAIENAQLLTDLGIIKEAERADYLQRAGVIPANEG